MLLILLEILFWAAFFLIQNKLLSKAIIDEFGESVYNELHKKWFIVIMVTIFTSCFLGIFTLFISGAFVYAYRDELQYMWKVKKSENKIKIIAVLIMTLILTIL